MESIGLTCVVLAWIRTIPSLAVLAYVWVVLVVRTYQTQEASWSWYLEQDWHVLLLRTVNLFLEWQGNYFALVGLVYTIADCFSCRIAFLNRYKTRLGVFMSVYTKPGKWLSDTISCQNNFITYTIFVVFFAYLPSNRSNSFALKLSSYQREVWERFVSNHDVYSWHKTVQIVPDPFSYHLLMWSRVVPDYCSRAYRIHAEPYKHNPNPIWKGILYVGDLV